MATYRKLLKNRKGDIIIPVTDYPSVTYGSGTVQSGVFGTVDYIKYGRIVFLLLNNISGNGVQLDRLKTLATGLPPAQEGQGGAAMLFTVTPAASNPTVTNPAVRMRINADGSLQAWYSNIKALGDDYAINTSLVYLAKS